MCWCYFNFRTLLRLRLNGMTRILRLKRIYIIDIVSLDWSLLAIIGTPELFNYRVHKLRKKTSTTKKKKTLRTDFFFLICFSYQSTRSLAVATGVRWGSRQGRNADVERRRMSRICSYWIRMIGRIVIRSGPWPRRTLIYMYKLYTYISWKCLFKQQLSSMVFSCL